MSQKQFDYIVVGGGSAGCTAAYRLARDTAARVLLLESGSWGRSPMVRMPIGFASLMGEGRHNWNYETEPEPNLDGRRLPLPRGRLMGGCSAINGMVYIRGQREDYDGWAAAGNPGWSYGEVLPYFKRSEAYWGGGSEFHGDEGLLSVNPVAKRLPVCEAFIDAVVQAGTPRNDDFNGVVQEGVGYYDANISGGIRHTTARAFLRKRNRPDNLTIVTGFDAGHLLFKGTQAIGVAGFRRGKPAEPIQYMADHEVVLSAGAFNSPKLLELSGIGDASRLQKLGIDIRIDLPGVGENLQDHCNNYLYFSTRNCETYSDYVKPLRAPLTAIEYLLKRNGIFANPAAVVGSFLRVEEQAARPDAQIHFAAGAAIPNDKGQLTPVPGVCASICRLQPRSVGSVHIQSNKAELAPAISGNYLGAASDREFQLTAVKKLRSIFKQPSIAPLIEQELPPLAQCTNDEELLAGIRAHAESVHHPVGSCKMGTGDDAVVTPELRVIGTQGLRIADASIMPRIPSGNTHAACVMIGEKVADLIQGKQAI